MSVLLHSEEHGLLLRPLRAVRRIFLGDRVVCEKLYFSGSLLVVVVALDEWSVCTSDFVGKPIRATRLWSFLQSGRLIQVVVLTGFTGTWIMHYSCTTANI